MLAGQSVGPCSFLMVSNTIIHIRKPPKFPKLKELVGRDEVLMGDEDSFLQEKPVFLGSGNN